MTRVNAGIPPRELHRAHLVAELREITKVCSSLVRSLGTKSHKTILKEIPNTFTLNTGHVKFFYDKLTYLKKRFHLLADEMERSGSVPNRERDIYFDGYPKVFYNDWEPCETDNNVVRARIRERIAQKPHLYRDILT